MRVWPQLRRNTWLLRLSHLELERNLVEFCGNRRLNDLGTGNEGSEGRVLKQRRSTTAEKAHPARVGSAVDNKSVERTENEHQSNVNDRKEDVLSRNSNLETRNKIGQAQTKARKVGSRVARIPLAGLQSRKWEWEIIPVSRLKISASSPGTLAAE